MDELRDGVPADEFCGFCDHHYTQHRYPKDLIVAVTCSQCPNGVCTR